MGTSASCNRVQNRFKGSVLINCRTVSIYFCFKGTPLTEKDKTNSIFLITMVKLNLQVE
jgi:hypothetical protein